MDVSSVILDTVVLFFKSSTNAAHAGPALKQVPWSDWWPKGAGQEGQGHFLAIVLDGALFKSSDAHETNGMSSTQVKRQTDKFHEAGARETALYLAEAFFLPKRTAGSPALQRSITAGLKSQLAWKHCKLGSTALSRDCTSQHSTP